jgi:hypothetical protein
MDSRELSRGGWFSCALVGHPEGLGVHHLPRVHSTREVMTTGQLLRREVQVKIPACPTNPSWEEWECKAQGLNLADTVQKAALEALTTYYGKHPDVVAGTAAKVIPVPERHTRPRVKREAHLPA